MYKAKYQIPETFLNDVKEMIDGDTKDKIELITLKRIISKYDMEKRNVIISMVSFNVLGEEIKSEHGIPIECSESYLNDFLWTVIRKSKLDKLILSSNSISNKVEESDMQYTDYSYYDLEIVSIRTLLDNQDITAREYNIFLRAEITSLGMLVQLFRENRFRLFQSILKGSDTAMIENITNLCNYYV